MNGKDIFLGLKYVGEDLIEEAECSQFSARAGKPQKRQTKYHSIRRPILVAALIALMLFLMGCAVVYVLSMKDLRLGEKQDTYDAFDYDSQEYVGKETVTKQVLTEAGLQGTPAYQAAREWFDFIQDYDPDHAIHDSVWGNEPKFPEEYDSYNLYSQEMKDKLDEIIEKYDLKYVGAQPDFHTVKNMCDALDITRILTTQDNVTVRVDDGSCWENGNFTMDMSFRFPEDTDFEITSCNGILHWNRKDSFSDDVIALEDTGDWEEWNYTTASGNSVLIIRSPSDWKGWILCDRDDAVMSLRLEARRDLASDEGFEYLYLTDKQMEQIADAIDFGIQPRMVTRADVKNQETGSNALTENGYTLELKSVETDGYVARIVMSITAPDGTTISHNPKAGLEKEPYLLGPGNFENFVPTSGTVVATAGGWNPREDGDGQNNTREIILEQQVQMEDGSVPFAPGKVWKIHFEDLVASYWDSAQFTPVEDILAEGLWEYEITFSEENGDYREIELIDTPVAAKAAVGMLEDGSDKAGDVTITSFVLRRYSASIAYSGGENVDFTYLNGERLCVVMKDGSQIHLSYNGWGYMANAPIDLDQVDHVLLPDGTKLLCKLD